MRFGIPRYRLPREILQAEIDRILALGVTLHLNRPVTDVVATMESDGFNAAFLAVGAEIGKRTYIPAGDSSRVFDAVSLLRSMEGETPPQLGRRVAIYGGGDTAMDAARTARRLGATDAVVVYRRSRDRMPAHDVEVEEAVEEGVCMKWLSTVKAVEGEKLVLERMVLDEKGFPRPTGELEELAADSLILALGQESDLSLVQGAADIVVDDGVVQVGPGHDDRTSRSLRRRRHGPGRAHGDRGHRPRETGCSQHRRLAPGDGPPAGNAPRDRHDRDAQHLVLRRCPQDAATPTRCGSPDLQLRRGGGGSRRVHRPLRGTPVHVVRELLRMR